jgi:hypothetical protein
LDHVGGEILDTVLAPPARGVRIVLSGGLRELSS